MIVMDATMKAYKLYMTRVRTMQGLVTRYVLRLSVPFSCFLLLCLFVHYNAVRGAKALLPVSRILWLVFCSMWFCALVSIFLRKHLAYREAGLVCQQCGNTLTPWYLVADRQCCPHCRAPLTVCMRDDTASAERRAKQGQVE